MSILNLFKSTKKEEEKLWDKVFYERKKIWKKTFGLFPSEIHKLGNLTGIWPGGLLIQMFSRKLGGLWVTSSFGLTNPDMPTNRKSEYHKINNSKEGTVSYLQTISARIPKEIDRALAGYGYEIAILTKEVGMWPFMFINTIVQMEILNDIGFLERVQEIGAVTIDRVKISETDYGNFIIFEAPSNLIKEFNLRNGKAKLLLAMPITDNEMNYTLVNGQKELLNLLTLIDSFPVGDLNRESILFQ